MPRQITEMPKPKPRGNSKYQWDEWIVPGPENRQAFVEGEDFKCLPSSFEVQVRNEASKRGLSATVLEAAPVIDTEPVLDDDGEPVLDDDGEPTMRETGRRTVLAVEFAEKPEPTESADTEDTDTES